MYVPPYPSTSVCSPIPCVLICHGDLGASVHPYVLGSSGAIGTSVSHSNVCQYIHCQSVHNSNTSWSPALWVASLLDWISMVVCYASCCCSFLCDVFIMSQASTIMAMTTTPLVTVMCSCMSSLPSTVTMAPP